jgi:hypothetical protein
MYNTCYVSRMCFMESDLNELSWYTFFYTHVSVKGVSAATWRMVVVRQISI